MPPPARHLILDAEHITKRFYQRFKTEQALFLTSIQGMSSEVDWVHYASLLLNRLMCAYFIQHKGLLDGDTNYLLNRLYRVRQHEGYDTFYAYFLLPLFHEGLSNREHAPEFIALSGTMPGLDLDLFAVHALEHDTTTISIADDAFERLFTFFNTYQWRLDGDPARTENELHPNVLGYIFEQHINQKQMGAYYTREDVTEYIASNTIIPHLFETVKAQCPLAFKPNEPIWQLLQTRPDCYLHQALRHTAYLPTETEREYRARRARYEQLRTTLASGEIQSINDLISCNLDIRQFAQDGIATCESPELLHAFYSAIEHMTILDPTCGSGAFLFAALAILEPLYETCLKRMQAMVDEDNDDEQAHLTTFRTILNRVKQHPNRRHFILTSIITNNLYGVDIMEEAVEMCQTLLSLKLLASIERLEDVGLVGDVGRNIRVGNALVGSVRGSRPYGMRRGGAFHWFTEFPDIMERGGFDVIIGNPPYVEYSKVRQDYKVQGYETESCGNLYAAVIERSLALCRPAHSYLGLIVPLSVCGGERFDQLRTTITANTSQLWLANFEIFPSRLFDGAFQRLSILIARHNTTQKCDIHVTGIQRWYAAERSHLIDLISYTTAQCIVKSGVFPKLASPLQEGILQKVLERSRGSSIAQVLHSHRTEHFVYYQEATNYWMKASCRVPFYRKNGMVGHPPHGRFLYFADDVTAYVVTALMNSSLFYLWFATYSDGFHLAHALVKDFPTGSDLYKLPDLLTLSARLEKDIKGHARMSTRNTKAGDLIEIEEYKMAYAKPLLDEIDGVLTTYYGFTSEELDFIVNYDIKYRMGQDYGVES